MHSLFLVNNAVVLDKYHAIVQDLIKCDELEASRETLIQETNAHVKKVVYV